MGPIYDLRIGMDIVWLIIASLVLTIVLFACEVLVERDSLKIILGVSLAMFGTGVLLPLFMRDNFVLYPSLMNPLVSLGLFLLMRKLFVRWKHREPVDTFFDWRNGLGADRWFNILYFTLGCGLLFLLCIGADLTGHKWH